ncbi:hypothetical protein F4819DRAFT_121059 [Hypoxylon fuscum]|nr:hypothetical protein F4819DRAFT_121059 [Hypoxylon fuscum]
MDFPRRWGAPWWIACAAATSGLIYLAGFSNDSSTKEENKPSGSDFIDSLKPFWDGCGTILLDSVEFESWFKDVEANTVVIDTMLAAVPLSYDADPVGNDYVAIPTIEKEIRERTASLAKAKEEFDGFLKTRTRIIHNVFSNSTMWQYYADGGEDVNFLVALTRYLASKIAQEDSLAGGEISKLTANEVETYSGVRDQASNIVRKIIQVQYNIWHRDIAGLALGQHLAAARAHVRDARIYEDQIVSTLQRKSGKKHLWRLGERGDAMYQLWTRLDKLQLEHNRMLGSLHWVKNHKAIAGANPFKREAKSLKKEAYEWCHRLTGLLNNWGTLLKTSHQGTLFMLRRSELNATVDSPSTFDVDGSWQAWKNRNCGGTTCYDAGGKVIRLVRALGMKFKPLAGRARDEQAWCDGQDQSPRKRPKVWRGVYESACCEYGETADFLKYGPLYTIPER